MALSCSGRDGHCDLAGLPPVTLATSTRVTPHHCYAVTLEQSLESGANEVVTMTVLVEGVTTRRGKGSHVRQLLEEGVRLPMTVQGRTLWCYTTLTLRRHLHHPRHLHQAGSKGPCSVQEVRLRSGALHQVSPGYGVKVKRGRQVTCTRQGKSTQNGQVRSGRSGKVRQGSGQMRCGPDGSQTRGFGLIDWFT